MLLDRIIRWGAALTLLSIVLAIAYGAARVSRIESLAIRWIDVTGPFERVSAEQIRAAAAPHLEAGFLAIDPAAVRGAVEGLPWVRVAEVEKGWPDTVRIQVSEHQPLAVWGDGRLLSENGQLFDVEASMTPAGLPALVGQDDHVVELVVFYGEMQRRLAGTGFDVRRLERTARGGWRAELSDGFSLVLGAEEPLPRLARFIAALPQIERMPGREMISADLRYGNGFAVKWRDTVPLPEPVEETMIVARHEG